MANKSKKKSQTKTTTKKSPSIPKNEQLTQPSTEERVPVSATQPGTPPTPPSPPELEDKVIDELDDKVEQSELKKPANPKKIPKVNKPKVEKKEPTKIDADAETVREAQELVDNAHRQLNPEQAVAWAMTQPDPVAGVKRLIRERRLNSPTDTLVLLEAKGYNI